MPQSSALASSPQQLLWASLLARSLHSNHMSSSKQERDYETPGSGNTPGYRRRLRQHAAHLRDALTQLALLITAVGCLFKTLHRPRSHYKHLHLRHGSCLAWLIRSDSSTSASSKTHKTAPSTTLNYARLSPPFLLLLERRNPPTSPGSLASELASHIHRRIAFSSTPTLSSRGTMLSIHN